MIVSTLSAARQLLRDKGLTHNQNCKSDHEGWWYGDGTDALLDHSATIEWVEGGYWVSLFGRAARNKFGDYMPAGAAHINEDGARNSLELSRVEGDEYRLIIFEREEEGGPRSVVDISQGDNIPALFAIFEDQMEGGGYFSALDLRYDTGALSLAECMEALLPAEQEA